MTPRVVQVSDGVVHTHSEFHIVVTIKIENREISRLEEFIELFKLGSFFDLPGIKSRINLPPCLDWSEDFSVPIPRLNDTPLWKTTTDEFFVFLEIGVFPVEEGVIPSPVPPIEPFSVRSSLGVREIEWNEFPPSFRWE